MRTETGGPERTESLPLGMDIGNGFGFVSLLTDETRDPQILLTERYQKTGVPTEAFVRGTAADDITILDVANQIRRAPGRCVRAIKLQMARGETMTLHDRKETFQVSTDAVYTAIARDILSLAEEEREKLRLPPARRLVLTYPAEFRNNPPLLGRMKRCVESIPSGSGEPYRVVGMLPEPAAAAFDYLHYMRHLVSEQDRVRGESFTVLVYDLGLGTFDAAIVTAREGQARTADGSDLYTVYASEGLTDVGGQDFDAEIYAELVRQLQEKYHRAPGNNANQAEQLRRLAVSFKHCLSEQETCSDDSSFLLEEGEYAELSLTRETFERLSAPLLDRTLEKTRRLLQYAAAQNIPVDRIVLSGGGSQMPMVTRSLKELTRDMGIPVEIYRPCSAVSFGAARFGPQCGAAPDQPPERDDNHLIQLAQYAFGLSRQAAGQMGDEVVFLIPSGERLPAVSRPFPLSADSNGDLRVIVSRYQERGRDPAAASPEECWQLIRFRFEVAPNQNCSVRFTLGEQGDIQAALTAEDGTPLGVQNAFDFRQRSRS